mmetsp:Transcript_65521/g.156599  ORF Transcript_65521/g.156599 Transcript_65521/m.156599 type:complete len:96 (+) Transcript_65521:547-834(+)
MRRRLPSQLVPGLAGKAAPGPTSSEHAFDKASDSPVVLRLTVCGTAALAPDSSDMAVLRRHLFQTKAGTACLEAVGSSSGLADNEIGSFAMECPR